MPIFYVVGAAVMFFVGQVTSPNPTVTIVDNGVVSETKTAISPLIVFREGDKVQVRGSFDGVRFKTAPTEPTVEGTKLYKNFFGEWTAVPDEEINVASDGR